MKKETLSEREREKEEGGGGRRGEKKRRREERRGEGREGGEVITGRQDACALDILKHGGKGGEKGDGTESWQARDNTRKERPH